MCASLYFVPDLNFLTVCMGTTYCAIQSSHPPPLQLMSKESRLTAVLSTLAAVEAALAALFAHEAAAKHGETASETATVLLLLGRRSLLVHGLLVLHLLGRWALLVSLLGVAEGRQYEDKIWSEKGNYLPLGRAVRLLRVLRLLVAVIALGRHCDSVVTSPFFENGLCIDFAIEAC